ncbi:MAG: hypothetical protein M3373_05270, partial [Gemmatimonadota bacterium]|nr:hypothetical protein [Gemmatimonadota bacterium]
MIALLVAAVMQAAPQQPAGGLAAPPQTVVRTGATVRPDTVTVGDPFIVQVRVRAPLGASVAFPAGPDSGTSVEATDPRALRSATDSTAVDVTAT